MSFPSVESLQEALSAAGSAHHEYETVYLNGVRDEMWGGWYAAYTLGRLGEFTTPTRLTELLEASPATGDWAAETARYVIEQLG